MEEGIAFRYNEREMAIQEELLRTKLYVPPQRPETIERLRLEAMLDTGLSAQLILISAPAGFGKTSLLREWLAGSPTQAAWISLDKGDNDPARFLRYFVAGIRSIAPDAVATMDSILTSSQTQTGPVEMEGFFTFVINLLAEVSGQSFIVLDDYHVIENRDIHAAVAFFIENVPSHVHLIISTRNDPPLPLARWRVRGRMTEIRSDDLRFSVEETRTFLARVLGKDLSLDDAAALETKTEGWAAGLQMAILSMQGRNDISGFIRTFSGSHRYIMDYLVEEVLRQQTEDTQTFLLRTSILERLNGDLCDVITEQPGGRQRLEMLESANMFLLPLDDRREWYRYHHLFADLLQARLQESSPDLVRSLHRRAARWYEGHGMIMDAVNHSQAAMDHERTAGLLEKATLPLLIRGELTTLLTWSEHLPEDIIESRPRLCINLALLFVFAGRTQEIERFLMKAENNLPGDSGSKEIQDMLGTIAALRGFAADMKGDTTLAISLAHESEKLLAESNTFMRTVLPLVLARSYRLDGNMVEATVQLKKLIEAAHAADNVMTLAAVHYELGATWKIEGKLRAAASLYEDTLRAVTEKGARHFGTVAKIDAGMVDVLREWNELTAAEARGTEMLQTLKTWKNPTDLVIAYLAVSRVRLAQQDSNGASEILEKAEHLYRNYPLFPPLGTMIETDRVRLWLAEGDLAAASHWAEERSCVTTRPLIVRELEEITVARVRLEQKRSAEASDLLSGLEESAEKGKRNGRLIEIHVLRALAFKALNQEENALAALERALYLAEPEGYMRVFLDAGTPMAELLFFLKGRRGKHQSNQSFSRDYLNRLLGSFPGLPSSLRTDLPEGLSERELEILRLMARGMTNQQIADELFITPGTVKAHSANIYRKLDAENRTQAVALARELDLLT